MKPGVPRAVVHAHAENFVGMEAGHGAVRSVCVSLHEIEVGTRRCDGRSCTRLWQDGVEERKQGGRNCCRRAREEWSCTRPSIMGLHWAPPVAQSSPTPLYHSRRLLPPSFHSVLASFHRCVYVLL